MYEVLKKKNNAKGFTLIELIVVIAILGVLAAVLIPQFAGFRNKGDSAQVRADAKAIAVALDAGIIDGTITSGPSATLTNDDPVLKLAGINITGRTITLTYSTDHSFTLTETINKMVYTASRTKDANSKIDFPDPEPVK